MKIAELLLQTLEHNGVTHIFGNPGTTELPIMHALKEHPDLTYVLGLQESIVVAIADGYSRASGRPGVCMAQQIGASNLAAGLRDGFMACSPMIAITGGSVPGSRYRHAYQEVEDFSQFDSVSKLSLQADDVSRLPDLLRQLFRAVTTGAPLPPGGVPERSAAVAVPFAADTAEM